MKKKPRQKLYNSKCVILFIDSDTKKASSSSRNLWVSGLASTTRATDLKSHFSKYGKVRFDSVQACLICSVYYVYTKL